MLNPVPFDYKNTLDSAFGYSAPAGNAQVAIKVADGRRKIRVHSLYVKRKTGTSGTAFQPRIANKASASLWDIEQKWRAAASTAAASYYGSTNLNFPMVTDASGYIYLWIDGDAADTFNWELFWEVLG